MISIMLKCTFLKDTVLKKHELDFIAVGHFIDVMNGGKQDQSVEGH
jgi:hypothetical protein